MSASAFGRANVLTRDDILSYAEQSHYNVVTDQTRSFIARPGQQKPAARRTGRHEEVEREREALGAAPGLQSRDLQILSNIFAEERGNMWLIFGCFFSLFLLPFFG